MRAWLAVAFAAFAAPAAAQSAAYPSKTVEIYVGYPAGTGSDSIARFFAERLRQSTGQSFVVVNKPGLYGQLAANELMRAKPDGHTLLITPNSTLTVNPHLVKNISFDAARDLTPVTTLTRWPLVLLVSPERLPVASVGELTALLKREPGKHNFASGHYAGRAAGELYKLRAGVDALHIPYKSAPAAIADVVAGRVDLTFADAVSGLPHVRSGRLKALAVTGPGRLAALPEVPTMPQAGVADFEVMSWFALLMPPNAGAELTGRVSALFNAALGAPETLEFFARISAEPFAGSPEALAELIRRETRTQGEFIKAIGIEQFE